MSKKIRVGILFGGKSAEHEISIRSAKNIAANPRVKKIPEIAFIPAPVRNAAAAAAAGSGKLAPLIWIPEEKTNPINPIVSKGTE